jgi:hypothetical protein
MSVAKGILFGVKALMKPVRVKTATSFTAEDPWNQGHRSSFKLEEYLLMLSGSTVTESTKATGTDFLRAIRSEADGVERRLPDSLSELWRSKRVPAEALPRLLKEAEPSLKSGDYAVVLRNKARWLLAAINTCICMGFVVFTIVGLANADLELLPKIVAVLVLAGGCWLCLYIAYYRTWFRRKRQMKWFLERANSGDQTVASAETPGRRYQQ